jgi:hypothetical protein
MTYPAPPIPEALGLTFSSEYMGWAGGAAFACFLSSGADAWDGIVQIGPGATGTAPACSAHELGHLLGDFLPDLPNISDLPNLMYYQEADTLQPDRRCRLTDAQHDQARIPPNTQTVPAPVPSPYFAVQACIPVPPILP